ncbi:MbnP family protein [Pedobacter gandavensis]|uniref:MbnP family protein n=1 Tax=Pedobacter gandavensis TaxID=2679963 RepID=UPI00292F70D3|nr:MbnP family protein [Pedobacter gandavensis]
MKKILTIVTLSSLLFTACSKDKDAINAVESTGKTTVTFDARFGNQDFALNTDFTTGGRTFNFNKFRYWISNVVLVNTNGEEFKVPASYYLLEETGTISLTGVNNDLPTTVYPATKREDVVLKDLKAGDYKTLKFSVGVDSRYNDNLSLLAGELSPLNGMTNVSWMWLTSYIFTSATGKVTEAANTKNLKIETGLNANYKTVTLELPQFLKVSATKSSGIVLNVDLAKVLDGIDVMTTPVVGAAQASTMAAVAGNYSTKVFSVKTVH